MCRSPFAELITRHLLGGRLGGRIASRFEIASAGTHAVVGAQMNPDTRDELMPWGLDGVPAGRFTARQLNHSLIVQSDLVLGASPAHRSAVVERVPDAIPMTFSLLQFARLASAVDPAWLPPDDPVKRARALVEQAKLQRGTVPLDPSTDRIPDPIGQPQHVHHEAAMLIFNAMRVIVDRIDPFASR